MASEDHIQKIIDGKLRIKNSHSYTDFTPAERARLQKEFDNWRYLTVAEAGIWLNVSIHTIYKMIKDKKIYASKMTGNNGSFKIDVEKSKQYLYHL